MARGYSPAMRRRGALISAFVAGLPALGAAADGQGPTPNMFAPVSTPAHAIREIAFFVLGITGAIFVVVAGLTLYTIIRFRRRAGDGHCGHQADLQPDGRHLA